MKANIARIVIGLAEYYDKTLNANQLEMYVEDLSVLTEDQLSSAVKLYSTNPENVFFPLPSKLLAIIKPPMNEKDEAQEVSNLIMSCVLKCGYTNPETAKQKMGDLAWQVVQQFGGWKHLCETCTNENEGMLRAQIRGLAESVSKRARRGEIGVIPALPSSSIEIKQLVNSTMKVMEK